MRKFAPLSAGKRYVLSSTDPTAPPERRKTEIVAGGSWQVEAPSEVSVKTTGINVTRDARARNREQTYLSALTCCATRSASEKCCRGVCAKRLFVAAVL